MSSSFYPQSDFLNFHSPSDVIAPHPDLFELDLEKELADLEPFQLQLPFDQPTYAIPRTGPSVCGAPSIITVSSESASARESLSSLSDSYSYVPTELSFQFGMDMNFQGLGLRSPSDYAQTTATSLSALDPNSDGSYGNSPASSLLDDHDAYGSLPPTSPSVHNGSVYSDYDCYPPIASQHPSLAYANSTVAPSNISTSGTNMASHPNHSPISSSVGYVSRMSRGSDSRSHVMSHSTTASTASNGHLSESSDDPRKKYQCMQCPRSFARAYNLKTHMSTHDPNRLKPHVCPHRACGRSFSRKHDLGRHLVSIHRDDPMPSGTAGDVRVGVAGMREGREWCDTCGRSNAQGSKGCNCVDVK